MNEKMEWMKILAGNKNYSEEDFIKVVIDNCYKGSTLKNSIQKELMQYRNQLLKQMDAPNFNEEITRENVQKWFLEPISEANFDILMDLIEYNYWTIEELWQQCKAESIGIFTLVKCLNKNIKFEKGMKVFRNAKLINELSTKNEKQIGFIKNDELFNAPEFLNDLAYYSVPIALLKQVKKIRTKRIENTADYKLTKENVEYLLAEPMDNRDFEYITKGMKINKWTLKELLQEILKTGFNILCVVGCPNKRTVGA